VAAGELAAGDAAGDDVGAALPGVLVGASDAAEDGDDRGAVELTDGSVTVAPTEGACCCPGCADGDPAEPQPAAASAAAIVRIDMASDRRRIKASGPACGHD
jgi:hypothetical protein